MSRRSPLESLRRDRTVQAVLGLVALALVARLVFLGARVAHQDEARVAFWTTRYAASGVFEYRSIVHGPFIPIVNGHLFRWLGASDFVARLPMAVLGAALPASALLFRERLRDSETVAFAALLAANPVLLYYSRFMRQDVPLVVFALFALGFGIRAIDAREFHARRRYVLLGALSFGLACTTKENVLLYPLAWLGAAALVWDHRMLRHAARSETSTLATVREWIDGVGFWRVAGAVVFLVANPLTVMILGVPGPASSATGAFGFVLLAVLSVAGYLGAVDSSNPLHYLAGVPLAVFGAVGVLGAGMVTLGGGLPDPGGGVSGSVSYVYTRFLAYYAVSWLLGVVLLFDRAVVSRPLLSGSGRGVPATDGGEREPDDRDGIAEEAGDAPDPERGSEDPANGSGSAGSDSDPEERPGDGDDSGEDTSRTAGDPDPLESTGTERHWFLPPMLAAYVVFFAVVVFFYAPRGGGYPAPAGSADGVGLWSALGSFDLTELAYVVWEATVGTWLEFLGTWGGGQTEHAYIPYFTDFAKTLYVGALTVSVAAGVGILLDRYGEGGPRDFVSFSAYWGVASVVGYPLVTDIAAPWVTVHAIVPLAVPAAVTLAYVYRWGARALATDDRLGVAIAGLVLFAVVGQVGYAAAGGVYLNAHGENNDLVQYAQSSTPDLKRTLEDVQAIARENEGTDVLYFGSELHTANESDNDQPYAGGGWFERLPIAWYTEAWRYNWRNDRADVVVDSTTLGSSVRDAEAPVIVALGDRSDEGVACDVDRIDQYLEGYRKYCGKRFLYDSGNIATVVFYVDADYLDRLPDTDGRYRAVEDDGTDDGVPGRSLRPPSAGRIP